MSDPVQPHRQQPTRLPSPWDSPGKNTGVGCHFLLQCVKVKSESEVAQSCPTHSDPMDCSLPGSSIHGIFQARVLEGVPLPSPTFLLVLYKLFFKHISSSCTLLPGSFNSLLVYKVIFVPPPAVSIYVFTYSTVMATEDELWAISSIIHVLSSLNIQMDMSAITVLISILRCI